MFGKKQSVSVEKILELIAALEEDEKQELLKSISNVDSSESDFETEADAAKIENEEDSESSVDSENKEEISENQEEQAEKDEEVKDALSAKIDALIEEFNAYKERVDAIYQKIEEAEKPVETVGLSKQRDVEPAEDEDSMSAHDYAMKHAKF